MVKPLVVDGTRKNQNNVQRYLSPKSEWTFKEGFLSPLALLQAPKYLGLEEEEDSIDPEPDLAPILFLNSQSRSASCKLDMQLRV